MADAEQQLREAYSLFKQGDRRQAGQIVQSVIKADRSNVAAWWLMANIFEDDDKKRRATERVLQLQPSHAGARKLMRELNGESVATSPKAPSVRRRDKPVVDVESDDYWSKIDTSEKSESSLDNNTVVMFTSVAFVLLIVTIIGILFYREFTTIDGTPRANLQTWIEAFGNNDRETLLDYTCQRERQTIQDAFAEIDSITEQAGDVGTVSFDVSGLEYGAVTVDDDAGTATIPVTGEIGIVLGEAVISIDVEDILETGESDEAYLIIESRQWRVCEPPAIE